MTTPRFINETPYVETNALLAVMNGDTHTARLLLHSMTRTELSTFQLNVTRLSNLIDDIDSEKSR